MQRDEEHNRYQLQIEDRSSGYPRQHTIGVDFVTAGEYRTLLANHRDMPTLDGDDHRSSTRRRTTPSEAEEPIAAADGTGDRRRRRSTRRRGSRPSRRTPRAGATRRRQQPTSRSHSLDELVEFFIAAGKKGIAINRYKGLGEMNPDSSGRRRWTRRCGRCCRCAPKITPKRT